MGRSGELRLDGRVALVTGGGRGMGRHHVLALADRGAMVVVADVGAGLHGTGADAGPAQAVVAEVRERGGDAVAYVEDLADPVAARGAVGCALATYGRLDVLVHNAGFTLGGLDFAEEQLTRLDAQLAINTRAAYVLVHEAWGTMSSAGYGRIVIAGSSAVYGLARSVPYATAKSSYIGLVRSLAAEGTAHGICVNGLLPSAATRMAENLAESELRTWFLADMAPELVSPVVVFLAHEDCPITGELLVVGGGRVARMVLGETPGFVDRALTPESLRDNLDRVLNLNDLTFPVDTAASLQATASALGHALTDMRLSAGEYRPNRRRPDDHHP